MKGGEGGQANRRNGAAKALDNIGMIKRGHQACLSAKLFKDGLVVLLPNIIANSHLLDGAGSILVLARIDDGKASLTKLLSDRKLLVGNMLYAPQAYVRGGPEHGNRRLVVVAAAQRGISPLLSVDLTL